MALGVIEDFMVIGDVMGLHILNDRVEMIGGRIGDQYI